MKYFILSALLMISVAVLSQFHWEPNGTHIYNSNSGNVGIGTNWPDSKLHIFGGRVKLGNVGTGFATGLGIYAGPDATNGFAFMDFASIKVFSIQGGNAVDYNTHVVLQHLGGNVGIGTTSPQQKLHVAGTIKMGDYTYISEPHGGLSSIFSNNLYAGVNNNSIVRHSSSDPGSYININYARGIIFGTGVTSAAGTEVSDNINERMRIDLNGNVGIGTNNPGTYKLAVEGIIGARKVKVTQAPWADYVFDASYRLRPLSEVEQYIQQYHHLPEVPTAAEVKKDGLDLGDNQATLLKKIEELTLYVIEQNKINKEQAKKLEQLQNEVNLLRKQRH